MRHSNKQIPGRMYCTAHKTEKKQTIRRAIRGLSNVERDIPIRLRAWLKQST